MSPEYAMEGIFSVKSDIYSFGILLLEIISGFRISSPHLIMGFPNLIAYVRAAECLISSAQTMHTFVTDSYILLV
jgi:serine/threonine protein kinase